jgi:DNA-binding NarL/FixJ family response regulator
MLSTSTAVLWAEIEEAIRLNMEASFDVILMDYHLPGRGGPKATEIILQRRPAVRGLGLSSYNERSYVDRMMAAGARGYILKNVEPLMLVTAIKTVLAGKLFYSNEIALKLLEPPVTRRVEGSLAILSPREREVFRFVLAGLKGW